MTWFVISESFLVSAWVHAGSGQKGGSDAIRFSVLFVGFCVAVAAYLGIGAAMRVLDRMGGVYLEAVELALKLPPMGHLREDSWTTRFGNIPALTLPPLIIGFWTGVGVLSLHEAPWTRQVYLLSSGSALATAATALALGRFGMWKPRYSAGGARDLRPTLENALEAREKAIKERR